MKEVQNIELDDIDKDLLLRKARLLYPEVEDWILNLSLDAYINTQGVIPVSPEMEEIN